MNKKVKHVWSILSRTSAIDYESNELSLIQVIDEITATVPQKEDEQISIKFPMQITSLWKRVDTENVKNVVEFDVRLEFIDPTGKKMNEAEFGVHIPKGKKRLRYRTNIDGIPATQNGEYEIKISMKDSGGKKYTPVATVPLDVKLETSSKA